MNIDFYWVLFLLSLFVFAAIGLGWPRFFPWNALLNGRVSRTGTDVIDGNGKASGCASVG
ncbi:hypothetical protein [Caballeronia sordidicola]|uniref:hypothetical protein n=1 Tax=Caballeronia sordidicola TaxID=196367 RepID=UPI0004D030C2|nr:hypothetical protein [Caballeronia sordidicola]